jgi:hypothetical protein
MYASGRPVILAGSAEAPTTATLRGSSRAVILEEVAAEVVSGVVICGPAGTAQALAAAWSVPLSCCAFFLKNILQYAE